MGRLGEVVLMAAMAAVLAGCGLDVPIAGRAVPQPGAAARSRECTPKDLIPSGGFGTRPKLDIPDFCRAPRRLVVFNTEIYHDGIVVKEGDLLTVDYVAWTWSDKKVLVDTFAVGRPGELRVGAGQAIPGVEQAVIGLKQSERRVLVVPPELAYGHAGGDGSGFHVAPDETLVFVIDVVAINGLRRGGG